MQIRESSLIHVFHLQLFAKIFKLKIYHLLENEKLLEISFPANAFPYKKTRAAGGQRGLG